MTRPAPNLTRRSSRIRSGIRRRGAITLAALMTMTALACTVPPQPAPEPAPPGLMPAQAVAPQAQQTPPQPAPGDIYTPPAALPPGEPGDVIWYQPVANWANARVIKVLYRSVDALGQPMAVSGTVFAPLTRAAGNPVVGYASETVGVTDDCAPSKQYPFMLDSGYIRNLLTSGHVVAMTDYEGLGTTHKMHTYMVEPSQAHAVLDMLRAVRRTPGADVPADAPMALWGYSQGGGAIAAAAEAAGTYAPELPIKGAAAGGVPADLVAVANFLNGGLGFGFLAAAAVGFDAAYPELDLDSFLNQRGKNLLNQQLSGSACLWPLLLNNLFRNLNNLTTTNPLQNPAWQARLAESKIGTKKPAFPVHLYHAVYDEIIPFGQANRLRQAWCQQGVAVQWTQYPIAEHLLGQAQGGPTARAWLRDRFAGRPAPSNCP